jgi:hypothetical protein
MVNGPKGIVLFAGNQDTLLNSAYRDRGNNNRDPCLRQPQIMCYLHPHFVQNVIEICTGLISAIGDLLLMASPLTPLRKINHWETIMRSQLQGPTNNGSYDYQSSSESKHRVSDIQ